MSKDKVIDPDKAYTYAGIGSRMVPIGYQKMMTEIAGLLEKQGYTLYSGAANGADSAFSHGCKDKIEFIPWIGFNGNNSGIVGVSNESLKLAEELHPCWYTLTTGAKKLMARNCHQILGEDLKSPVDFVLCWTKDGAETQTSKDTGGTGQAIRLAIKNNIPVINMANSDWYIRLNTITGLKYIPTYSRNSEEFKALMSFY